MTISPESLDGRIAIVTGGARGIGLAAVRALAASGVRVVAFDLPGSDFSAVGEIGDAALPFEGDVTRSADWLAAIDACGSMGGVPSILFNNAGITGAFGDVLSYPDAEFDRVIAVNVRGVFLGMKYVGAAMADGGGGVIVNVSSVSGFGGSSGIIGYAASKAAVNSLTKAAAITLAPRNVRVLAIAPCPTETDMMGAVERRVSPDDPEAARPALTQGIPMGRYGRPDEIADVLLFLVSDRAAFMTGSIIPVDGGVLAK